MTTDAHQIYKIYESVAIVGKDQIGDKVIIDQDAINDFNEREKLSRIVLEDPFAIITGFGDLYRDRTSVKIRWHHDDYSSIGYSLYLKKSMYINISAQERLEALKKEYGEGIHLLDI